MNATKSLYSAVITALLLLCSAAVQASPEIQHWQISNKARVYFVPAPQLPMVDVRIIFDAAGAHDGDLPGKALLTNGLLTEGTKAMSTDEIADTIASVGAQLDNSSHRDMSIVSLRSLTKPELLKTAVKVMHDVITEPTFPEESLERERQRLLISLQAKKQSPGALASDAFFQAAYANHPYRFDASGIEESVKKIQRADLVEHYKRYYVGANAVIAIVGAVDRKQAEALAEAILGDLPTGKPATAIPDVADLSKAEMIRQDFPSTQTHILMGQPAIERGNKDFFPLFVGNHVLGGGGFTSRLTKQIREDRGLAYSSYSYFSPMHQRGPFIMGMQTRNDKAEEALKVTKEVLAEFMKNGPTAEELELAKKNIVGGFALNLDSNSKIVENIAMIGFYHLPLDYLDHYTDKVEAVTIDQIKAAFKRHLNPDKMVTVMLGGSPE